MLVLNSIETLRIGFKLFEEQSGESRKKKIENKLIKFLELFRSLFLYSVPNHGQKISLNYIVSRDEIYENKMKLESIYLYFPPSSHLVYLCFCPVGLSLP